MPADPEDTGSDTDAGSDTHPQADVVAVAGRNIMLTLAYQGTAYCGWQVQPNGLSVQECVERAVEKLTGTKSAVLCAGRTDAGVHALGQVANFRTNCPIPAGQLRRALQSYLPEDIVIVRCSDVATKFHATYSAVRKRYRYVMFDGPVCPPFLKTLIHRSRHPLDADAMNDASGYLLGTHDFRCFESQYPNKQTSVRTIMEASVTRLPTWLPWQAGHQWQSGGNHPSDVRSAECVASPFIVFDVMADGFLYNMVRAIVGTLVRIGLGQQLPEGMRQVIESQDRSQAGMNLPPGGLYLVHVDYPPPLLIPDGTGLSGRSLPVSGDNT